MLSSSSRESDHARSATGVRGVVFLVSNDLPEQRKKAESCANRNRDISRHRFMNCNTSEPICSDGDSINTRGISSQIIKIVWLLKLQFLCPNQGE